MVATAFGGPEVLRTVEVAPGDPGPGQVLLDVRAAAVNPIDWKMYAPGPGNDPSRLPLRLGLEVAGVVAAVGPSVRWLSPGDEVIAWRVHGGYASHLVVSEQVTCRRPSTLDWPAASGLLLAGTTAVHTLSATGAHDGDVVLVHGGSGGVGRMAVQLAILRGARVIATGSPDTHDDLRALGAVPVAHGPGLLERVRDAERTTGPVTVAIDTVGSDEALDVSVAVVADRLRVATIAGFGRAAELGVRALGGGPGADPGTAVREAARAQLAELAADGSLDVRVARTFALDDAADAHRLSREGHARGKLVLVP
ncbi:Alcohol dehydrogenase GroES domain protein [Cellulomonas fimi ATCC 484]|uniref:Alcohol dehydrogenase GroES domain protein n=1 Tax=Cellulomonas fimi (strain ATCC 484 / DSM 20113 / JCM 1341 / CCUG 24087 / LMG 16345 / NBRC 15513 / NCIMB 8980 / NCTC 7547 / NRS-133) TaxID=590998 RepID=F4GY74_CELFA|nr:Alcohol dehydrogenase GroES domain protein [Cellulomonas fimi ATCC 484]VEH27165.1 Quinone oxidoreductase 1 [Cellulomonas fimi]